MVLKSNSLLTMGFGRFERSPFEHKYSNDQLVNGLYANRVFPISWGDDPDVGYRTLRSKCALFDCPHRPIEISGPDALIFLEKILTRSMASLKIGRARYALACQTDGGILMDGVVMRLSENCYWFAKADGEFDRWLEAHSIGYDLTLKDPHSRILQIQGPTSLEVMRKLTNGALSEAFGYYHVGWFEINGERLLVSRSGFTGEMGYEIYTNGKETRTDELWDNLIAAGEEYGLTPLPLQVMDIRRIEAGIRNNRTDLDEKMTPYKAGLGTLVDLEKGDFLGRGALRNAPRDCLLFGFKSVGRTVGGNLLDSDFVATTSFDHATIILSDMAVGQVTAAAFSPYLNGLIGNVCLNKRGDWSGKRVMIQVGGDNVCEVELCELPFYDKEKLIPRGFDGTIVTF